MWAETGTEQNNEAHPEQACLATTKHTFVCSTWAATAVRNILTAETALKKKKKTPPQHKKT